MDSIRDDLNAAVAELGGETDAPEQGDQLEADPPQQAPAAAAESGDQKAENAESISTKDSTDAPAPGRDEKGRFASKEAAAKASTPRPEDGGRAEGVQTGPPGGAREKDAKGTSGVEPPASPAPESRAPQSWRPTAREKWAALPPEVQAEVLKNERDTKGAIGEAAEARKLAQAFRETVGPFEGFIRAAGREPMQAIAGLLQTEAALRTSPLSHKANLVASLMDTYGVTAEALDAELVRRSGGQAAPGAPHTAPQAFQDPRVDQMLAERAFEKRQAAERAAAQNQAAIAAFAEKHEFFEDVRADMGDLIDMNNRRGVALSLEDAYARACLMNKEIAGVLQQREAAKQATSAQASVQRARAASSSVRAQPAVTNGVPMGNGGIRDDIEAAIAELSGR